MEMELKKKNNYNFHTTKHLSVSPLLNPGQTTRIFISTQDHHFRKPPRAPFFTPTTTFTNSTRLTIESALYIFSFDFQPRVPFSPYSLSSPQRARGRAQEPRRQQRNNSFPLPYTLALSPLFIYRSFVERETARPSSTRIPPSERERVTILDLARIHRRALLTSRRGPLSFSLSPSFPAFRCRFHRPRAPTIHALHNAYSLQRTQQPTQQEVRRVEEEEREERRSTHGVEEAEEEQANRANGRQTRLHRGEEGG